MTPEKRAEIRAKAEESPMAVNMHHVLALLYALDVCEAERDKYRAEAHLLNRERDEAVAERDRAVELLGRVIHEAAPRSEIRTFLASVATEESNGSVA